MITSLQVTFTLLLLLFKGHTAVILARNLDIFFSALISFKDSHWRA